MHAYERGGGTDRGEWRGIVAYARVRPAYEVPSYIVSADRRLRLDLVAQTPSLLIPQRHRQSRCELLRGQAGGFRLSRLADQLYRFLLKPLGPVREIAN